MTAEHNLSEKCRKREREAFRELYGTYAGRLLSLCVRYVGSKAEAEDILQDSFIKIIQSFDSFRYRGEGSLYAWMSRITVNGALDKIRQDSRFKTEPVGENLNDEIPVDSGEVAGIPEAELMKMIQELPPGYRTVFNMFAIDGYSHKEIGRALGIKERTSSSQYFKARAMLAKKINDYLKQNG